MEYELFFYISPDGALLLQRQALESEPESSVINFVVAATLYDLGRFEEALPPAAKSESRNPQARDHRALHAAVLLSTGRSEEAHERAELLAEESPVNQLEAFWMAELFRLLEDHEAAQRIATLGLGMAPGDSYFQTIKLNALLELDLIGEASDLLASIDPEQLELDDLGYLAQLYRMRTSPMEELPEVLTGWAVGDYADDFMIRLAEAARRSGEMHAVRARVESWLEDTETPSPAWRVARPWFDDDQWVPTLDRFLARHPAAWPSLLRIAELDKVTEAEVVLAIASRARQGDDPMTPFVDDLYFGALSRTRSYEAAMADLEEHLVERPEHRPCLYRLAGYRAIENLAAGRALLDRLEELAADDPAFLAEIELHRLELALADGEPSEVLSGMVRLSEATPMPYRGVESLELTLAEAAFHAGDLDAAERRVSRLRASAATDTHAAAMLIRWCSQWSTGQAPTYGEDVAEWIGSDPSPLRSSVSPSAQGILLAEGLVDRSWARRAIGHRPTDTFALVESLRNAETDAEAADAGLRRIALSELEGSFGRRLARSLLEKRGASPG